MDKARIQQIVRDADAEGASSDDAVRAHRDVSRLVRAAHAGLGTGHDMPYLARRVAARARDERPGMPARLWAYVTGRYAPHTLRWSMTSVAVAAVLVIAAVMMYPGRTHASASRESFVIYRTEHGHLLYQYIEYEETEDE